MAKHIYDSSILLWESIVCSLSLLSTILFYGHTSLFMHLLSPTPHLQLYWGKTDVFIVRYYKCTTWWFDIHIHHERFPNIELTNPTPHIFIYIFIFGKKFKFFSLSKFQLYNALLSTVVTMFYIISSDLISLAAASLYPLNKLSLFPPHNMPWQPLFYSVSVS